MLNHKLNIILKLIIINNKSKMNFLVQESQESEINLIDMIMTNMRVNSKPKPAANLENVARERTHANKVQHNRK